MAKAAQIPLSVLIKKAEKSVAAPPDEKWDDAFKEIPKLSLKKTQIAGQSSAGVAQRRSMTALTALTALS